MIDFNANISLNLNEIVKARFENRTSFPINPRPGQFFYLLNNADNRIGGHGYIYNSITQKWDDLIQNIENTLELKGSIDASTNPNFPVNPDKGDVWIISVSGKVGGLDVQTGNQLIYDGLTWILIQSSYTEATTLVLGYVRLATFDEAKYGSHSSAVITAQMLQGILNLRSFQSTVSLEANIPYTILHNLFLNNPTSDSSMNVHVSFYDSNGQMSLIPIKKINANTLSISANRNVSGKIICSF